LTGIKPIKIVYAMIKNFVNPIGMPTILLDQSKILNFLQQIKT